MNPIDVDSSSKIVYINTRQYDSYRNFSTTHHTLKLEAISKIVAYVQGQGVELILKRSAHVVREHLKSIRTAAIGRKMHF